MEHCYIKLAGEWPEKQTNMVNTGGQQLNSVLTVQLMGFFCCSNEIFLQGCATGKKCPETGRSCAHAPIHRHADNIRQKETTRSRKSHPYIHFFLA